MKETKEELLKDLNEVIWEIYENSTVDNWVFSVLVRTYVYLRKTEKIETEEKKKVEE